jgi:hypothetical protein
MPARPNRWGKADRVQIRVFDTLAGVERLGSRSFSILLLKRNSKNL